LHQAGYPKVDSPALKPLFEYLNFASSKSLLITNWELKGLEGEYVIPGPGGDPIRNPDVLPTGKNILDPQSIPQQLLYFQPKLWWIGFRSSTAENDGKWPETIACVLWEPTTSRLTVNPQVMWMVGCSSGTRCLGSVNKLELISLQELGRPRIDV